MSKYSKLGAKRATDGGSFTDVQDLLLTLFADPDCRGDRCWLDVLGEMARRPARVEPGSFLAHAIRARAARVPPSEL